VRIDQLITKLQDIEDRYPGIDVKISSPDIGTYEDVTEVKLFELAKVVVIR
jgi:hypothetical protein